jgi:16S rRNA C967 or C1407 C5-methylase (RsmB/RsmF family)
LVSRYQARPAKANPAPGGHPGKSTSKLQELKMADYENLLSHLEHHNAKKWLLDTEHNQIRDRILKGCEDEDANTIKAATRDITETRLVRRLITAAVEDLSDNWLNRRLARILSQDD